MTEFERRLTESLRYAAEQARPTADPLLTLPSRRPRTRRGPEWQPARPERGGWWRLSLPALVAAGVLLLLTVAVPAVLHDTVAAGGHGRPAGIAAGQPGSPRPGGARPAANYDLTVGLYVDHGGDQPLAGRQTTIDPGGYVYLIVTVLPAMPAGKTYLQQRVGARWVTLGPHDLDSRSRVAYLLWPNGIRSSVWYRVWVPGSGGRVDGYSEPVMVLIRR